MTHQLFSPKNRDPLKPTISLHFVIILLLIISILASACGGAARPESITTAKESASHSEEPATEGEAEAPPAATIVINKDIEKVAEVEKEVEVRESTSAEGADLRSAGLQQLSPLKAGEVDDNEKWDDYLAYRLNYQGAGVHERDVSERYIIEVQDGQGYPVLDANIRIFLDVQQSEAVYETHTYANGQALFHPKALAGSLEQTDRFLVAVSKENAVATFTLPRIHSQQNSNAAEHWTVTLDLKQQVDSVNLDLLFLVDATGSMEDEINAVQNTIFDVAARIDRLPERPNVRYGLVTYRDRGDEFISRVYDFEADVADFSRNLETVYARGGGDYPESLNEGLHNALHNVQWRGEDTVRLIFLIADAPPHLDYAQDYDYAVEMETAARSAIKIYPIASSGLDDQGEYIFRQLAQFTQGRFIFLTYDGPTNGGQPGEVTTHHVDSYSVSNLDDLLVVLVTEELAYQNPLLVRAQ